MLNCKMDSRTGFIYQDTGEATQYASTYSDDDLLDIIQDLLLSTEEPNFFAKAVSDYNMYHIDNSLHISTASVLFLSEAARRWYNKNTLELKEDKK